jgi:hypothetical protein
VLLISAMFSYLPLCFVRRLWFFISFLVISLHAGACQESGLHYGVQGAVTFLFLPLCISLKSGVKWRIGAVQSSSDTCLSPSSLCFAHNTFSSSSIPTRCSGLHWRLAPRALVVHTGLAASLSLLRPLIPSPLCCSFLCTGLDVFRTAYTISV